MSRILPPRPHLEHLKSQAKALLGALEEEVTEAHERYRSVSGAPLDRSPRLADAQLVIAREYGFPSWPRLKAHIEALARTEDPVATLVNAVKANDLATVADVLERVPALRARINEPLSGLPFGGTVLLSAVSNGNREMIEILLGAGADINQRSDWWAEGFGVLDSATPELADWLIEHGARLDPVSAARLGRLEELREMVARDPRAVHARGGDGHTPLHEAANLVIAQFLVEHGADVNALDVDHESTPAQYLIRDRQDIVRYLVARGSRTDILMAAALGDLALVQRHLDADRGAVRVTVSPRFFPMRHPHAGGTIYNWTLGRDKSPHVVAREFGHEEVVQLLLKYSPDDLKLALAVDLGDEELFRRQLEAQPQLVKSLRPAELRKLPDAARDGNLYALGQMLAAGWPLDARGDDGGTALHWAAWHGNREMVKEILRYQPELEVRGDQHNMTALGWLIHGSLNSWHCKDGDYSGSLLALLEAGARVPALRPETEMSDAVRAVLARKEGGAVERIR
jgi:ankyrin repeat protein